MSFQFEEVDMRTQAEFAKLKEGKTLHRVNPLKENKPGKFVSKMLAFESCPLFVIVVVVAIVLLPRTRTISEPMCWSIDGLLVSTLIGPIHTGRGTRHATQRKQMGPIDVNGGVHTACKQHQKICVRICACASSVDWALILVAMGICPVVSLSIDTPSPPPNMISGQVMRF